MKILSRKSTHIKDESHDCLIGDINGKKIKITYRVYPGYELCTSEIFDGVKLNHVLSLLDMGFKPNDTMYICSDIVRKERANKLFKEAEIILTLMLKK